MSDALPTEGSRALEAASGPDRDAKIEELLLAGLDHYFTAQYEQAINVWTRALFLDRNHPRARAYIERARSALAERQRESEELLQRGMSAFQQGDGAEARRLLQAALDGGAPPDEALALLDRLNRLSPGTRRRATRPSTESAPADAPDQMASARTGRFNRAAAAMAAFACFAAGLYAATARHLIDWQALPFLQQSSVAAGAPPAHETTLPPPRRGELALERARRLAAGGHLHDALAELDAVRATDAQKAEADRLRADIQRQLVGLARP